MLSDREIRRMTEQRIVTIDEVNVENNHVTMHDQYNTLLYASLDFSSPIITVPAQGETWVAERTNTNWHLVKKYIEPNSLTHFDPGSTFIDGDLRLDGKILWGNAGSPWDTDLYRYTAGTLATDGRFNALQSAAANNALYGAATHPTYTGNILELGAVRGDSTAYNFINLGNAAGNKFQIRGDSSFIWGGDTTLYRSFAQVLKTDGGFRTGASLITNHGSSVQVDFNADGHIYFGLAADTTLYRSSANILKTDHLFQAGLDIYAQVGLSTQLRIGNSSGNPTIEFGSALDTRLYRSASATLKTDGSLIATNDLYARIGTTSQVVVGNAGPGGGIGINGDTNLYRFGSGFLATDGAFYTRGGTNGATAFGTMVTGEAQPRWFINASGVQSWGLGTTWDTNLYRDAGAILRTDNLFRTPGIAYGSSSYGTAFPGSPIDGQVFTLVDSTSTPTYQWTFRYNAGSGYADKWEFIGGSPRLSGPAGSIAVSTTQTTPIDVTGGPTVTLARGGVYNFTMGGPICNNGTFIGAYATIVGLYTGAGAAFGSQMGVQYHGVQWDGADASVCFNGTAAANTTLNMKTFVDRTGNNSAVQSLWLKVIPIRVS